MYKKGIEELEKGIAVEITGTGKLNSACAGNCVVPNAVCLFVFWASESSLRPPPTSGEPWPRIPQRLKMTSSKPLGSKAGNRWPVNCFLWNGLISAQEARGATPAGWLFWGTHQSAELDQWGQGPKVHVQKKSLGFFRLVFFSPQQPRVKSCFYSLKIFCRHEEMKKKLSRQGQGHSLVVLVAWKGGGQIVGLVVHSCSLGWQIFFMSLSFHATRFLSASPSFSSVCVDNLELNICCVQFSTKIEEKRKPKQIVWSIVLSTICQVESEPKKKKERKTCKGSGNERRIEDIILSHFDAAVFSCSIVLTLLWCPLCVQNIAHNNIRLSFFTTGGIFTQVLPL